LFTNNWGTRSPRWKNSRRRREGAQKTTLLLSLKWMETSRFLPVSTGRQISVNRLRYQNRKSNVETGFRTEHKSAQLIRRAQFLGARLAPPQVFDNCFQMSKGLVYGERVHLAACTLA